MVETMQEFWAKFDKEREAFLEKDDPSSDTYYHYTTFESLDAILRKGTLKLTDYYSLNDKKEFTFGLDVIKDGLNQFQYLPWVTSILNMLINEVDKPNQDFIRPYVFSMSTNPNSLPMWRCYADDAKGVCLGFKLKIQKKEHIDKKKDLVSARIVYGKESSLEYFNKYFKFINSSLSERVNNIEAPKTGMQLESEYKEMGVRLLADVITVLPRFKHKDFRYEDEIRLFFLDGRCLKTGRDIHIGEPKNVEKVMFNKIEIAHEGDERNERKYSYQSLNSHIELKEIILNPRCNFDKVEKLIKSFINKNNLDQFKGIEIKQIASPYIG